MDNALALTGFLEDWHSLPFEPFREGVEVHYIKQGAPALAILRYAPGATVPRHLHRGMETILVLEGVQSDERGDYAKGALVVNPEGSTHSVWSDRGCAVLIQWERPVEILDESDS
ncbi:MAG: cupin domain-containing protein [Sulfitobacter sp.]|nr:cupin domain-containing protein [Sulfitobacter sp.]